LQPQRFVFFGIELKREVGGESFLIASDLLVKALDGHAVKLRKVSIEDDPLMAKKQDARFCKT